MNNNELSIKAEKVIAKLAKYDIAAYVDTTLVPPKPHRGNGKIKLIIVGQDPTVQKPEFKRKIKVVLLLNQDGGLKRYLGDTICKGLDIDLDENIYATNLLKNFFTIPPDTLRKTNPQFFQKAAGHWIPLLKEEIEEFENVPVLTLGEPVLNSLTKSPDWVLIRYSWGYEGPAQYGQNFGYIKPEENVLSRILFPFPHLPGLRHKFYRQQMPGYLAFMKQYVNP